MAEKKTYRTAAGREVDFQKLQLQNETVRAVGNMNVNARGDVIDNANKTTSTRSAQVNKSYRKQIGNVARDLPIVSSKAEVQVEEIVAGLDDEPVTELVETPVETPVETQAETPVETQAETPVETQAETPVETQAEVPVTGLAAAMAKARESKSVKEPEQE